MKLPIEVRRVISYTLAIVAGILVINNTRASSCGPVEALDQQQVQTLYQSYNYGKEYNMGLSLAAIAWQESNAGLYPINISDPSFGVHHILLSTAMKRSDVKNTNYHRNMLASKLLDHNVSASFAIKELQYWSKYHKGNWSRIWASYNAGHNYKVGVKYSNKIKEKVKMVKYCLIVEKVED